MVRLLVSSMGRAYRPWQDRFMDRVELVEDHWLWRGRVDYTGAKRFTAVVNGAIVSTSALKFAKWLKDGARPKKREGRILNTCGNKNCIRPEHCTGLRAFTTTATAMGMRSVGMGRS